MPTLNFDHSSGNSPRNRSVLGLIGIGLLASFVFLSSTLASNISLNSGAAVEFGQGVAQTTACDEHVVITPHSQFTNATGAGSFNLSSITVSEIDSSSDHCMNKSFTLRAFSENVSEPLLLFGTNHEVTVQDDGTHFFDNIDGVVVTSNSTDNFTITFVHPVSQKFQISRITIQSGAGSGYYQGIVHTSSLDLSCDGQSVVLNNQLSLDHKLSASSFTGTVRIVISATGGSLQFGRTSGLTVVQGYQDPIDTSAPDIAAEGLVSDINAALDSLTFTTPNSCDTTPLISTSIIAASSDGSVSYNPQNGHYYQFINSATTWDEAFNDITGGALTGTDGTAGGILGTYNLNRNYASCHYKFNGLCGYMATVTSESEDIFIGNKVGYTDVWLGGSDRRSPGRWVWEDDRAPEYNTSISSDNTSGGDPIQLSAGYANWNSGEPNNYGSNPVTTGETALQTYASDPGVPPTWNNLPENDDGWTKAYIIEYGQSPADSSGGSAPQTHLITVRLSTP